MQTDQTIQSSTVQLTYILSPEEEEQAIAQYEETQMMLLRNSLTKDILKPRVQNIKMDRGKF